MIDDNVVVDCFLLSASFPVISLGLIGGRYSSSKSILLFINELFLEECQFDIPLVVPLDVPLVVVPLDIPLVVVPFDDVVPIDILSNKWSNSWLGLTGEIGGGDLGNGGGGGSFVGLLHGPFDVGVNVRWPWLWLWLKFRFPLDKHGFLAILKLK